MSKTIIHWDTIISQLPGKEDLPKIDYIIALVRGGTIPATLISYKLKTNNVLFITTELYDPETNDMRNNVKIKYPLSSADISRLTNATNILIVDDILDTGATLVAVKEYLETVIPKCPNLLFYTCCTKTSAKDTAPEIYENIMTGNEYSDDAWIVFPWDQEYVDTLQYYENDHRLYKQVEMDNILNEEPTIEAKISIVGLPDYIKIKHSAFTLKVTESTYKHFKELSEKINVMEDRRNGQNS